MKNKSKIILTIETIAMYILYLPLAITLLTLRFIPNDSALASKLLLGSIIAPLFLTPFVVASFIIAATSLFVGGSSPTKTTVIIKICLIPWYVLDFCFGIVLIAGFLNPFMLIAVPIIFGIFISATYLIMLSTSIHSMCYFVHYAKINSIKLKPYMLIGLVLSCIFCLDIIGAILLNKAVKPQEPEITIEIE